jgi:hypothetical protein
MSDLNENDINMLMEIVRPKLVFQPDAILFLNNQIDITKKYLTSKSKRHVFEKLYNIYRRNFRQIYNNFGYLPENLEFKYDKNNLNKETQKLSTKELINKICYYITLEILKRADEYIRDSDSNIIDYNVNEEKISDAGMGLGLW